MGGADTKELKNTNPKADYIEDLYGLFEQDKFQEMINLKHRSCGNGDYQRATDLTFDKKACHAAKRDIYNAAAAQVEDGSDLQTKLFDKGLKHGKSSGGRKSRRNRKSRRR
jgi:hypothetical protein